MPEQKKRGFADRMIRALKTPVAGAAFAALTLGAAIGATAQGYVATYNGVSTIQGVLPPPGQTTYVGGDPCANINNAIAQQQAQAFSNNPVNNMSSSISSCMSGLGLGLPGIPGFSLANLMNAINAAACQVVTSKVMSVTQPVTSLINTYSPGNLGSQVGIQGTGVNLNSAMTYGATPNVTAGSIFSTP